MIGGERPRPPSWCAERTLHLLKCLVYLDIMINKSLRNCKLCGESRDLVKSHILPRFFYQPMERDDGRPFRYKIISIEPDDKILKGQGGIKEPLLCFDCDNYLSNYENYASKILSGDIQLTYSQVTPKTRKISGIDYNKFKLFQLSLLWRSSVSSQDFFNQVRLGPIHENQIRNLILNRNPGPAEKYPCIMIRIINVGNVVNDLMIQPVPIHIENHKVYRFIMAGFTWLFFVSTHKIPYNFQIVKLDESGNIIISDIELSKMENVVKFTKELKEIGKLPLE